MVLQALYRQEFVETSIDEIVAEINLDEQSKYITQTLNGISALRSDLDKLIDRYALGWRVERLAILDRNILRLGLYEVLYSQEIAPEIAINEAVELAKRYGTENAPSFINGILDRAWKEATTESKHPANA